MKSKWLPSLVIFLSCMEWICTFFSWLAFRGIFPLIPSIFFSFLFLRPFDIIIALLLITLFIFLRIRKKINSVLLSVGCSLMVLALLTYLTRLIKAHMMDRETFEEVRFVLNTDMDSFSPMSLVLVAQNELWDKLRMQQGEPAL